MLDIESEHCPTICKIKSLFSVLAFKLSNPKTIYLLICYEKSNYKSVK